MSFPTDHLSSPAPTTVVTVGPLRPLEYTYHGLSRALQFRYGKGAFHAAAALREIYRRGNPNFYSAPEFARPPGLAPRIAADLQVTPGVAVHSQRDGELVKFVTCLEDGGQVESVIIPMESYHTVCVSSQVGCRMGCRFCVTGRLGFTRNLTVEEIVGQVYAARFTYGAAVRNVVFMGMGEPLDNLAHVIPAIAVLEEQRGLDIARRHMTVSTCGLVPGIEALAREFQPSVPLAISLNAADDACRTRLMPINAKYPLAKLLAALNAYPLSNAGRLLVEYVL
ncbi:MAG: radical SAM protein, partial [Desulfobacterales bacterium]